METPRFYCWPIERETVVLDDAESRHALRSLRLDAGAEVELFDGRGRVARGVLRDEGGGAESRRRGKKAAGATVVVERVVDEPVPTITLTLIVAGCKGARLDWLVEKCTELGVTRIVLAEFERSVVRAGATHVEKLRRTALEACKQCGRNRLPEIVADVTLAQAVVKASGAALLVAHPAADAEALGSWLSQHAGTVQHVAVVVGPEGGLSAAELELLERGGGRTVRLAEHILRVETAAVAVAAAWSGAGLPRA